LAAARKEKIHHAIPTVCRWSRQGQGCERNPEKGIGKEKPKDVQKWNEGLSSKKAATTDDG
jgi:hypothetical protein